MTSNRFFLVLAVVLFVAPGCGDFERGDFVPGTEDVAPGASTDTTNTSGGFGAVLPLLEANCAGCHGSGSATAFRLTGDADQDFAMVSGLVTVADPAQSRLLLKGSSQIAHGGGAVLDPAGAPYQTILAWITAGAPR